MTVASMEDLDQRITSVAEMLAEARLPVVSTGAGMSRESGVRTFRGEEGYWKEHRAEELASIEGIRRDPVLVWNWYRERLRVCDDLVPHAGYRALVRFQEIRGKFPAITQNVDGLHQKAGLMDVIELHGSLRTASCIEDCGGPAFSMTEELLRNMPPRCSCGSILRPDVVLFGEQLPIHALERAFSLASSCDLMMVIGTSMAVYPASELPVIALRNGADVIEINVEPTPISTVNGTVSIKGEAGKVLPRIIEAVEKL